ncbi:MAG: hypothetical protein LDLANPLL_01950 [Turneriella sp.]|nr:hypothetical protein [Turneriella sp.]
MNFLKKLLDNNLPTLLDSSTRKFIHESMRTIKKGIVEKTTNHRQTLRNRFITTFLLATIFFTACKKEAAIVEAALTKTTTVTAADLKLRIAPNTTAVEIARLPRGEQVQIVQRSADSVQIGKKHAYWYKVTNSGGLTGWAYGAGLAIESDEGNVQEIQANAEKKLRAAIIGRWEAATIQGKLTPNFVALYSDGNLEFGTNRAKTQTGKYEILFNGPEAQILIKDIKAPMMTDIKAKIIGETLVFTATMGKNDYKLNLADKDPGSLEEKNKEGVQAPAPSAP